MQPSSRFHSAVSARASLTRSKGRFVLGVVCSLLLVLPACGGSGVNTVPVTGRVTYRGSPLKCGTITFSPEDKTTGRAAWGTIDAEGNYALTTIRANDGALPGEYRVAVLSFIPGTETALSRGKPAVPQKYSEHTTSELTATVGDRATTANFDLQ